MYDVIYIIILIIGKCFIVEEINSVILFLQLILFIIASIQQVVFCVSLDKSNLVLSLFTESVCNLSSEFGLDASFSVPSYLSNWFKLYYMGLLKIRKYIVNTIQIIFIIFEKTNLQ